MTFASGHDDLPRVPCSHQLLRHWWPQTASRFLLGGYQRTRGGHDVEHRQCPVREYVSIDAAGQRPGVSTTTIRRCISNGQLRALRTGRRLIPIRVEDLEELFSEIPTAREYSYGEAM